MSMDTSGDDELSRQETQGHAMIAILAACDALRLLTPEQIESLPTETKIWWRWKIHQEADKTSEEREGTV